MATDLTWIQLQEAIGANGTISYDAANQDIVIRVKPITGDNYNGIGNIGVIEFVAKLFTICRTAQTQSNTNAVAGSRLNAFQAPQFGVPFQSDNGQFFALATYTMQAQLPVSFDSVQGTQI